ncbi:MULTISPECIES: glycosyltransferase family 2 protein [unclassified Nostoc]|uniref:glycosyltransferase family 2 protein n=1 Tax=unclassified Nostoc TaxID=2593658 RepID=UPI000B95765B|nr:glycosyltransferase family 2 protein [Nostoc sp. 'Peltigera membranacea cyanobiont' 232]OYE05962.1 glycosyltransferase [Nostoc sp. 'Peltigera membranacea cyanobiont' 232]
MQDKEKIGIVLATYNPQIEYFKKQIQSIQNQTWQNWVCYIVDDCSQPKYQAEIKKIVGNDSRFICHFHSDNLKHYYNFERGLQYCVNDFTITAIAFSDQDDIWQAEKLEILIAKLRSEQLLLVHSDLELINSYDETINPSTWNFEERNPENATVELLLLRNVVTGCSLLFCTSLIPYILPFPQHQIAWHHDWWVALVAIQKGKIGHIRQPLIRYRIHSSNTVGVVQDAGKIYTEFIVWASKKYKITGKSYLFHYNLSKALYDRFQHETNSSRANPFDTLRLDFGLPILKLCYQSWCMGYGSEGIALRIWILKVLFDLKQVQKLLLKIFTIR